MMEDKKGTAWFYHQQIRKDKKNAEPKKCKKPNRSEKHLKIVGCALRFIKMRASNKYLSSFHRRITSNPPKVGEDTLVTMLAEMNKKSNKPP